MPAGPAAIIRPTWPPGAPPGPSRGAPGRLKSINFSPQEAPRRRPLNFLGPRAVPGPPPRAIWGAPGGHPGPTWRPEVPRSPPGLHFGPSGPPPRAVFFAHFLKCPAFFLHAFTLPFAVLFRVRVRLRSLFSGLRRFNFESWKPWIPEALGGRRGSRSDKNYYYCSSSSSSKTELKCCHTVHKK